MANDRPALTIAILAVWIRKRDRRFALGVSLMGIAFLIPWVFNPAVYAQYFEMSRTESLTHFSTSTLGTLLRIAADDPTRFVLYEAYTSAEDAGTHKQTQHYLSWRDTVADMMAEPRHAIKYANIYPAENGWDMVEA